MSVELISRLNAKSQDLRMLPPGFEVLTQSDLSHAISLIQIKGARLLARVAYADQKSFAPELSHELLLRLKEAAKREKWHNTAPIKKLAAVAVTVYCAPQRCQKCRGLGERMWGAKKIQCPICVATIGFPGETVKRGSGWSRVYWSDIAFEIGVVKETMSRTWKRRYGLAIRVLMNWDRMVWDDLAKAIKRLDNRQRNG